MVLPSACSRSKCDVELNCLRLACQILKSSRMAMLFICGGFFLNTQFLECINHVLLASRQWIFLLYESLYLNFGKVANFAKL